jgi:integrase
LVGNTVLVERARVVRITREETKTDAGRRLIDLRRGALQAILDQRQFTSLENDLVFHDPYHNAGWQDSSRISTRWNATLKKAGVRQRVLYQTRHTFASTLLSSGANPLYVAKQMGHKDTTMVTKTYGKWIELEDNALPDFYEKLTITTKALAR